MTFFEELWNLTAEMAPYLLLGFLVAGFFHVWIPKSFIKRHLAKKGPNSVFKAVLMGIPLPLCSCGVIPVANQLRKDGAENGSVIGFLVATPSTGVDSIFATWGMIGLPFTVLRSLFSLFAGLVCGLAMNLLPSPKAVRTSSGESGGHENTNKTPIFAWQKIKKALHYGFVELVQDAQRWLILGLTLGALIAWLLPPSFFEVYLDSIWLSYLAMILMGLPMYVCATGSIPIAATMMAKGLSPGAALVFLTVGPVTNTATMSFVWEKMGKRGIGVYLSMISVLAVLMGMAVDLIFSNWVIHYGSHAHDEGLSWWKNICGIFLLLLILKNFLPTRRLRGQFMKFSIPQIHCHGCKTSIEAALSKVKGVDGIEVNVKEKTAKLSGRFSEEDVLRSLRDMKYKATRISQPSSV